MWAARVVGVAGVVAAVGGAVLPPTRDSAGVSGRQLLSGLSNIFGYGNSNNINSQMGYNNPTAVNNQGYSNNQLSYNTAVANNQHLGASTDYNTQLQQYASSGYYDAYASPTDYSQESYVPAVGYGTAAESTDSSPALSALALLGFLYFLNLIQDVLQNNNGRKRRSLQVSRGVGGEGEDEGHYITSYLDLDEEPYLGRAAEGEEQDHNRTEHLQVEPRSFSFLEDFFIRLPIALGLRKRQMIERNGREKKPMAISNFISTRVKMISSIMSFLQDPSPSRIRRALEDPEPTEPEAEETGRESWSSPSLTAFLPLIVEVLRDYTQSEARSLGGQHVLPLGEELESPTKEIQSEKEEGDTRAVKSRVERHSPNSMNAWYNELGGRNKEATLGAGKVVDKVVSLLGGGDEVLEAVRQDGPLAFLELSRGLVGGHPPCLLRGLCHLNSRSRHLTFFPQLALQLLSSNLADLSQYSSEHAEQAMKAGLRGEDCKQLFTECDNNRSLKST